MRPGRRGPRLTRMRAAVPALFATLLLLASAPLAQARDVVDATGRTVTVPDAPASVFAAGPPASVLLYALKRRCCVTHT